MNVRINHKLTIYNDESWCYTVCNDFAYQIFIGHIHGQVHQCITHYDKCCIIFVDKRFICIYSKLECFTTRDIIHYNNVIEPIINTEHILLATKSNSSQQFRNQWQEITDFAGVESTVVGS